MSTRDATFAAFYIGAFVVAIIAILATVASWDSKQAEATRVLGQQGITVNDIGWSMWGCSKDDTFSFAWSGVNEKGEQVNGYACSDFFKGTTIRFK